MVTSAGNSYGASACSQSPASAADAIAVGATTNTDSLSSFSNVGSCVNTFAPGRLSGMEEHDGGTPST